MIMQHVIRQSRFIEMRSVLPGDVYIFLVPLPASVCAVDHGICCEGAIMVEKKPKASFTAGETKQAPCPQLIIDVAVVPTRRSSFESSHLKITLE